MSPTTASKLPRFLQSPAQRDRSKSLSVDRPPSSASSSASHATSSSGSGGRRFLGLGRDKDGSGSTTTSSKDKERERQRIREQERAAPSAVELLTLHESQQSQSPTENDFDSPPSSYGGTARPRTRSERHFSFSASTPPSSTGHAETLALQRTPSRLGEGPLATRLSGWFAHLAGSTSDLSLAATISGSLSHASALASSTSSARTAGRKSEGGSGGGGGGSKTSLLDKAVRYLLDGDAAPDRSTAPIWLLGVQLPGWGPADDRRLLAASTSATHPGSHSHHKHAHAHAHADGGVDGEGGADAGAWPAAFHAHFYAQVWCTYRAGFEPIRDLPSLASLPPPLSFPSPSGPSASASAAGVGGGANQRHSPAQSDSSVSSGLSSSASHSHSHAGSHGSHYSNTSTTSSVSSTSTSGTGTSARKKWWPLGGTKGWTSDAGWGCMLRTGQSLLATAVQRAAEGAFLDAPAAPFGVHRMALAGKAAGKDVGMWFGPSAAASALRTLVDAFPECGLGVSVATDGTLYQTEVFAASHSPAARAALQAHAARSPTKHAHAHVPKPEATWGDRPVLLLLGIRLGLDGVNPVYHETIKLLYTFPQSVGIAGGRPSSSYYFVGVQGDGLFYLDPHHSRPAVPLRPFIPGSHPTHEERRSLSPEAYARGGSLSPDLGYARGGSMSPDFPRGGSLSPDFARAGSMSPDSRAHGFGQTPMTEDELVYNPPGARAGSTRTASTDSADADNSSTKAAGGLSPAEEAHFARAYSTAELRTFHCARVRKMPLTGLDPSMLLGFVCRNAEEWADLRRRVGELPRTIFGIQDEPPTWPGADDDDDMGLESVSDPEEEAVLDDGDVSSASHAPPSNASHASHAMSNTSHIAVSTFSHTHQHSNSGSTASSGARSEEVDTEEDAVAPLTPLPNARFDISGGPSFAAADDDDDDDFVDAGEIEDDWVDPVAVPVAPPAPSKKERERERGKSAGKSKGKKKAVPVPVPSVHYPFPVSVEDAAPVPIVATQQERQRNVTVSPRTGGGGGQRMHTARARDGGRTQSGGVRGVLTED
ncbi:hypothetical protein DFH09DRAFT_1251014 [Mycena vulgaris]|nr:hypothetical protein DFH09DRAFT_1251014 [Mycena vulgaris]